MFNVGPGSFTSTLALNGTDKPGDGAHVENHWVRTVLNWEEIEAQQILLKAKSYLKSLWL